MDRKSDKVGIVISLIFLIIITVFAINADKAFKNKSINVKEITYEEKIEKIPIASLGSKTNIEGNIGGFIFVQSGYLDSEKYYEVMLVDKNYSDEESLYQYLPLKALDTRTFEFKDESKREAYIRIKWTIKKVNEKEESFIPFNNNLNNKYLKQISLFTDTRGYIEEISIHAPKGTINKDFSINFNGER